MTDLVRTFFEMSPSYKWINGVNAIPILDIASDIDDGRENVYFFDFMVPGLSHQEPSEEADKMLIRIIDQIYEKYQSYQIEIGETLSNNIIIQSPIMLNVNEFEKKVDITATIGFYAEKTPVVKNIQQKLAEPIEVRYTEQV